MEIKIKGKSIKVCEYNGQRIIFPEQLFDLHGIPAGTIASCVSNHPDMRKENHSYIISGLEAKELGFPSSNRGRRVFTEKGYKVIAKNCDDRKLVLSTYFSDKIDAEEEAVHATDEEDEALSLALKLLEGRKAQKKMVADLQPVVLRIDKMLYELHNIQQTITSIIGGGL